MVDISPDSADDAAAAAPRQGLRGWQRAALIALIVLAALLAGLWLARERLAGGVIDRQLAALDLPATYTIESIAPGRQVLTDVVVGDPAAPDLTVERVVVELRYGFGLPTIGTVVLDRPRLFGSYGEDGLSFGSLDGLLFAEDGESTGLPDLDVTVNDGRALLETPYGPVGAKLQGEGNLSGGFAATLAVNAPLVSAEGCRISAATAFGRLTTASDSLGFTGPVRMRTLDCDAQGVVWRDANVEVEAEVPTDFASASVSGVVDTGRFGVSGNGGQRLTGPIRLGWRDGALDAALDLEAQGVSAGGLAMRQAGLDGAIRLRDGYGRIEADGELSGEGADLRGAIEPALASVDGVAAGTLLEPLLAKFRSAASRQLLSANFAASFTARSSDRSTTLVMPELTVVGAEGSVLVTASRVQYASGLAGVPRLAGNFRAGGPGLPSIAGRMERAGSGATLLRLRMEPYAEGANRLAVPELSVTQGAGGALAFDGLIEAGGILPGGSVRQMRLPLQGRWNEAGGLALWEECTTVAFDRLEYANLVLSDRNLRVCPASGRPIVSQNGSNLRIAAGLPSLDLGGTLAGTPIRLRSGPVGFAYPGTAVARDIDVTLGVGEGASRFNLSGLEARFEPGGEVAGNFSDTRVQLAAVPLDLVETAGDWRYSGGALRITGGAFRLVDRQTPARFNPLIARDATLTLEDNAIAAFAELRHPASDRVVTATTIAHNLSSGTGNARLAVDGLPFDEALQPDDLTDLALGVVANVRGAVSGTGRIDWSPSGVTSSGEFTTDGLDLAAAFGPVRGASGTVIFTDLLSLTTAPNQQLRVASVNPGIEVTDGTIGFSLQGGQLLGVTGGSWPFMGGTLRLRPVDLNLGTAEKRRYVLDVEGLDAAIFVQDLELGNIAATGIFDGSLPLVFDELGNGYIESGTLTSRPPGGNLSYIGELTYEDLSLMANYAFGMLRSLDYRQMQITIEGPLTGDILSKIRLDGVKQGADAERNFITRQLEDVPLQFNINVTAPFYKLIGSLKAMYDPAFVKDPREIGLINSDGTRRQDAVNADSLIEPPVLPPDPAAAPELPSGEPAIQRRESE